jgi:CRISPR-associated endonuclease/helicase Cas3
MKFPEFFKNSTGYEPYPFQELLAESATFPSVIDIPTGIGKTASVILAWLWRRRFHESENVRRSTPRRLVYCLPMRALVEQTRDNALLWLEKEGLLGGKINIVKTGGTDKVDYYQASWAEKDKIVVTTLMGGEEDYNWDIYPERDAIIIGTQDMLLSRALNRGYGMNRYKWPAHFGLLNNDCLWIMDEIQLMGSGLTTSVQLEAFRKHYGTAKSTQTTWMSATINQNWLNSIDFGDELGDRTIFKLTADDYKRYGIRKVLSSNKTLKRVKMDPYDYKVLADEVLKEHSPGTRTLVILNTVDRAVKFYRELQKKKPAAEIILIHSHFRSQERSSILKRFLEKPGNNGTIAVSTQVLEAGVDISAKTLFTELAPWSSMVQRFGRCNRYGEFDDGKIFWIDLLGLGDDNLTPPYVRETISEGRDFLISKEGNNLGEEIFPLINASMNDVDVIRPKDILELFNTDTDLTGQDIDISRFIRNDRSSNVQVFWRDFADKDSLQDEPFPRSDELCSAPVRDLRKLIKQRMAAWTWDFLDGTWAELTDTAGVFPGRIIMLKASEGHYSSVEGWEPSTKVKVLPVFRNSKILIEGYGSNVSSINEWKTIAEHTDEVVSVAKEMTAIIYPAGGFSREIILGARWHDAGKGHGSFQAMIRKPAILNDLMAKAPPDCWNSGRLPDHPSQNEIRRKHFRHELVSGLLALENGESDLIAYLAASHHGKVRVSIRAMPDEYIPMEEGRRYACGVWDGDIVPSVNLGSGLVVKSSKLDLSIMELGTGNKGYSWLSRILNLINDPELGIFRLGFLEAIVRAADRRASGGT